MLLKAMPVDGMKNEFTLRMVCKINEHMEETPPDYFLIGLRAVAEW